MNIVFVAQAVDSNDMVLASTVRWIRVFAEHANVNHVSVVTLRAGEFSLPSNVEVTAIGRGGRLVRLLRFYRAIRAFQRDRGIDAFFIYQGGPYPLLLLPWRLFAGVQVYQWKAHPHVSRLMWFYARFCDTRVFTSTASAFPVNLPNISIVGNGIDVTEFSIRDTPPTRDLVIVGRLSPSKRIEVALEALAIVGRRHGYVPSLDLIGPDVDPGYRTRLEARVNELDLAPYVTFAGGLTRSALPERLQRYRAFVNVSDTALDRAVLEAMACGLPVISSNPCVREILPPEDLGWLCVPPNDADMLAERIHAVLALDATARQRLGRELREVAVAGHSDVSQSDRILSTIGRECQHQ